MHIKIEMPHNGFRIVNSDNASWHTNQLLVYKALVGHEKISYPSYDTLVFKNPLMTYKASLITAIGYNGARECCSERTL